MTTDKGIQAFIRRSIKADAVTPDVAELRSLLDKMSLEEMQLFWMHFAADRAYSATNTVPHWKTKEQMVRLQHEHVNWMFFPKDKDVNGKYIVVRADLEEHIQTHLLRHIDQERRFNQAYRMRPLVERLHVTLGMALVMLLWLSIPLGVCSLIAGHVFDFTIPQAVFKIAETCYVVLFVLYVLVMPALRWILRARH